MQGASVRFFPMHTTEWILPKQLKFALNILFIPFSIFFSLQDTERIQEDIQIPNSHVQYPVDHKNGVPKLKDFSKVTVVVDFEPHDDIVRHRITLGNNVEKLL